MKTDTGRRIVIVGGGITGLSAAFYAQRLAEVRGERLQVTVLESSGRLGGRIDTLRRDGFVIERGPDSFLARKLPMLELARDLGMERELVAINPRAKSFIVRRGRLHPMPPGMNLGVPTDLGAFAQTGLISPWGKLRALGDLVLPRRRSEEDESLGGFLKRRLGGEMVARIAEPLLAGIYAGDLYRLSLRATFPQFAEMERRYGGLIRGSLAARRAAASGASQELPAYARGKTFLTFRRGLSSLVEALEAQLGAAGCDIRLNAAVAALTGPDDDGGYRLRLRSGEELAADAVLLALPAFAAAELLAPHTDVSALRAIRYVSVATVVLGYEARGFGRALDGAGFVVPRSEGRYITACTWTSTKWLHTAPDGKRLIRCYVGRAGDEGGVDLPDEAMVYNVRRDLRELMELEAKPAFVEITRLHRSMPQYPVGHVEAVAAFRAELARRLPGVLATGAPFGGVGLPDCVAQGRAAAASLLGE